ncbi:hypothetical protein [Paenibacillus sp. QZ-Y1]|uniref:hypothetical protein n=1 Tax=Paenibacillus sp. QZ-Y1 TaxID=3414511 RepID=UPI003F79583E
MKLMAGNVGFILNQQLEACFIPLFVSAKRMGNFSLSAILEMDWGEWNDSH